MRLTSCFASACFAAALLVAPSFGALATPSTDGLPAGAVKSAPPAGGKSPLPAGATNLPPPPSPPSPPVIEFPGQYAGPGPESKPAVAWKACSTMPVTAERLACTEHVLNDWPRLSRFATANAALAAPAKNQKRVVFLGDSITDNWSKQMSGGFFPGKGYINRGIGSQTTGQMLLRLRADVLAHKPSVVVILAGTNDIAGNNGPATLTSIQDNLTSMVELARANGVKVILSTLLPVCDCTKRADGSPLIRTIDRPLAQLRALNQWIQEYARKQRLGLVDYFAATADAAGMLRAEYTYDGLHPNAAGYAVMGPLVEKELKRLVRR